MYYSRLISLYSPLLHFSVFWVLWLCITCITSISITSIALLGHHHFDHCFTIADHHRIWDHFDHHLILQHLYVLPIVASCDSMWRTVIAFYIYLQSGFLWNKLFSCCHGFTFFYSFVDIWSFGLLWWHWHLFVHSSTWIAFINSIMHNFHKSGYEFVSMSMILFSIQFVMKKTAYFISLDWIDMPL